MQTLTTYDPNWEAEYIRQHERLPAIWQRAVAEWREAGRVNPNTKAEYIGVIETMRRTRQRQYRTPAEVAKRVFNIVSARATLAGEKVPQFPKAEEFKTIKDVRDFLQEQTLLIKKAQAARRSKWCPQTLPVLPKGEGDVFNGTNNFDVFSQAVYLPDVAGGTAFILTSERIDDTRVICLSSRRHPEKFFGILPQVANAVYERLFKSSEEASDMQFFVHYPHGYGRNGGEEFWRLDLRPDARGQFTIHGMQPMPMVPYGIANKRMNDGEREGQSAVLEVPRGYDPYIASWASGFEAQQFAITQQRRSGLYIQ